MKLTLPVLALSLSPALAAQEPPAVLFHLVEGWAIVVDGTIGGIPNRKIMIDTGAVPSAVNNKFAKQLNLAGSFQKLSAMSRSVDAQRLRVPNVRIGPLSADALDMMAVNLESVERRLDTHIHAVIGIFFLSATSASITCTRSWSLTIRVAFTAYGQSPSKYSTKPAEPTYLFRCRVTASNFKFY